MFLGMCNKGAGIGAEKKAVAKDNNTRKWFGFFASIFYSKPVFSRTPSSSPSFTSLRFPFLRKDFLPARLFLLISTQSLRNREKRESKKDRSSPETSM